VLFSTLPICTNQKFILDCGTSIFLTKMKSRQIIMMWKKGGKNRTCVGLKFNSNARGHNVTHQSSFEEELLINTDVAFPFTTVTFSRITFP